MVDQWRLLASANFSGSIGGNGTVFGTAASEEMTVLPQAGGIVFDPSFNRGGDVIRLSGNAGEWTATLSGSNVVLERGYQKVTVPVGEDGLTLAFEDGARDLKIEGDGVKLGTQDVTGVTMIVTAPAQASPVDEPLESETDARLIFFQDGEATVSGDYNVFGTVQGAESLRVLAGNVALDPSFSRGGDTLMLDGPANTYDAKIQGSNVIVTADGKDIAIPIGPGGISLSLGDGARALALDELLGTVLFGSQTLSGTTVALEASISAPVDQVLFWNAVALETISAVNASPTTASRAMAIQSIAIFDAISATGQLNGYLNEYSVSQSVDLSAVVAHAAHDVLVALFPERTEAIDARLADFRLLLGSGLSYEAGRELGEAAAAATLQARNADGADFRMDYLPNGEVGSWTAQGGEADAPQWASVLPFALDEPDQFRSPPPPDLASEAYANALNEVKALGSRDSTERTADQTEIAMFWRDMPGSNTAPGHWNVAAQIASIDEQLSLSENALAFAMLDIALADTAIAAWDSKYEYAAWRPQAAIRNADRDGNPLTEADPGWVPLFPAPLTPGYPSGHAAYAAAASSVLTALFGEDYDFVLNSQGVPDTLRRYDSFEDAAREAAESRIYAGASTRFAVDAGNALGHDVGDWVIAMFSDLNQPLDSGLLP